MSNAHSGVAVLVGAQAHEVRGMLPESWQQLLRPAVSLRTLVLRVPLREPKIVEDANAFLSDRDFAVAVVHLENLSDVDFALCSALSDSCILCGDDQAAVTWAGPLGAVSEHTDGDVVRLADAVAHGAVGPGILGAAVRAAAFLQTHTTNRNKRRCLRRTVATVEAAQKAAEEVENYAVVVAEALRSVLAGWA